MKFLGILLGFCLVLLSAPANAGPKVIRRSQAMAQWFEQIEDTEDTYRLFAVLAIRIETLGKQPQDELLLIRGKCRLEQTDPIIGGCASTRVREIALLPGELLFDNDRVRVSVKRLPKPVALEWRSDELLDAVRFHHKECSKGRGDALLLARDASVQGRAFGKRLTGWKEPFVGWMARGAGFTQCNHA